MSFKSKILKLSIILMLILVLIPAVAAEDSDESFYIEYAESEEVIVEESYSIDEVEYGFEDTSENNDVGEDEYSHEDLQTCEVEQAHDDISAPDDHLMQEEPDVVLIEPEEGLNDAAHYILDNDENYISYDNDIEDINEHNEDDLTIEEVSVTNQGSLFVSKNDCNFKIIIMIGELLMETTFKTSGFNRSLSRILELKNDILINRDVEIFGNDLTAVDDGSIIVCINKISSDYVFSIDNSVVGEGNMILVYNPCFLKFYPYFNAYLSCGLLTFERFFAGDFVAFKLFLNFAVEHTDSVSFSDNMILNNY